MNKREHQVLFERLCQICDIRESTIKLLSPPDVECDTIPALQCLTDEEKEQLLNKLTVGQRSCMRLVFAKIHEFNTVDNQPIGAVSNKETSMDTEFNHEEEFQSWCESYRLDEETIKLLRFHSCDSLPALKYLSLMEMELLLFWDITTIGQRSALKAAIAQLRDVNERRIPPLLQHDGDIIEIEALRKYTHWQLPIYMAREIGGDYYLQEIIQCARGILDPADIDRCSNSFEDLWRLLDTRGIIEVGKYDIVRDLLEDAKLPKLVKILDRGMTTIKGTYREDVCTTLFGTRIAHRRSSSGRNGTNQFFNVSSVRENKKTKVTQALDYGENSVLLPSGDYQQGVKRETIVPGDHTVNTTEPSTGQQLDCPSSSQGNHESPTVAAHVEVTTTPASEQVDNEASITALSRGPAVHEASITVPSHVRADHESKLVRGDDLGKTFLSSAEQDGHEENVAVTSHEPADHVEGRTGPSNGKVDHKESTIVPLREPVFTCKEENLTASLLVPVDTAVSTAVPPDELAGNEDTAVSKVVPLREQSNHDVSAAEPSHVPTDPMVSKVVPSCTQSNREETAAEPSHVRTDSATNTVDVEELCCLFSSITIK